MLDSGTGVLCEIAWRILGGGWDAEGFELGGQVRIFYPFGRVVDLLVIQYHASCAPVRRIKIAFVVWMNSLFHGFNDHEEPLLLGRSYRTTFDDDITF